MRTLRQIAALMVATLTRWIQPLYGHTAELFAKPFFWLLVSFNVLSVYFWLSPSGMAKLVAPGTRGRNLLIVTVAWMLLSAFFFRTGSVRKLADEARARWPSVVGRENWILGAYVALTAACFWGQVVY
jgi:hypothetical protein